MSTFKSLCGMAGDIQSKGFHVLPLFCRRINTELFTRSYSRISRGQFPIQNAPAESCEIRGKARANAAILRKHHNRWANFQRSSGVSRFTPAVCGVFPPCGSVCKSIPRARLPLDQGVLCVLLQAGEYGSSDGSFTS